MWTFGKKMGLGFALTFLVMVAIGAVAVRGAQMMTVASAHIWDGHETLRAVDGLTGALADAETGQRGFVLSGNPDYLSPFIKGEKDSADWIQKLKRTAYGRTHAEEIAEIERNMSAMMTLHRERIEMRKQKSLEEVMATAKGQGRRLMDSLRDRLGTIEVQEENRMVLSGIEMADTTRMVTLAAYAGTAAGLVVMVLAWITLQRTLTTSVGVAAQEVQQQSTELQASSNQQAAASRETATSMTEISITMQELLATSKQIATNAKAVAQSAEETNDVAQHVGQATGRNRATVGKMREQVDLVVQQMVDLGRKTQGVGTILGTVQDLAERTNILAINATIEATVSGEHGTRFAIVADEIRRLADLMREATRDIQLKLEDVWSSSNATVMATEQGAKAVDSSATMFDGVNNSLLEITDRVTQAQTAAKEIQLATQQQSTAVAQLETALSGVTQAAREAEQSSAQTLQTAVALTRTAGRLRDLVKGERLAREGGVGGVVSPA